MTNILRFYLFMSFTHRPSGAQHRHNTGDFCRACKVFSHLLQLVLVRVTLAQIQKTGKNMGIACVIIASLLSAASPIQVPSGAIE